jgi:hypothetical protein
LGYFGYSLRARRLADPSGACAARAHPINSQASLVSNPARPLQRKYGMKRLLKLLVLLCAPLLMIFAAAPAFAASPHFKHGGSPTCTISGSGTSSTSTTCTGSLTGLGGGDVVLETTVSGSAVYQCQNAGGNIAPGQNRVLVGPATTPTIIPGSEVKNGNLTFVTDPAVLTAPSTVSGAAAGCPNANWTGVNPTLTLTDITLTISQGGATLFTCTASNPNGLSGTVPLSC